MTVTDNEIITALEHCSASMDCDSCNFGISENCVGDLLKVSLDLIIRLKEANKHHEEETKLKDKEIEILIRKKEALKDEIAEKDAEIERLKNAYKDGVKRALLEVGDGLAHYGKCDELYLYEVTNVLCRVEDELTGKYDDMFTKNRNLEAEIDRLKESNKRLSGQMGNLIHHLETAKSEAYEELAEKYKDHIRSFAGMFTDELGFAVSLDAVLSAVDFVSGKATEELTESNE